MYHSDCVIQGNTFIIGGGRAGIELGDGTVDTVVKDNIFTQLSDPNLAIRDFSKRSEISGNRIEPNISSDVSLTGGVLYFPDALDTVVLNATGGSTVQGVKTNSAQIIGTGLAWIEVTAGGTGYTSAPTVSFSGGGGSGAAATAKIRAGVVMGIDITNRGSGYTSNPTVTISGGGGSGAAASSQAGLPQKNKREITINSQNACTVAVAGTAGPNIQHGADLSVPAFGSLTLLGRAGLWRVKSKSF
jgi:hypothetical protein